MNFLMGLAGLLGTPLLQETAEAAAEVAASAPVEGLTIQAAAMILIPAVVQLLKKAIPAMEGKNLFYANMALNLLTAVGVMMNMGTPAIEALTVGFGGALAGSKIADVSKRGITVSERHRK